MHHEVVERLKIGIKCGGNLTFVEDPIRKDVGLPARETYGGIPVPAEKDVDAGDKGEKGDMLLFRLP